MPKDLRTFIQEVLQSTPEGIKLVSEEVDPRFGVTAFASRYEREGKFPPIYFSKVKGSSLPLIIDLTASYERLALALGTTLDKMVQVYGERQDKPIPPQEVRQAPCKEVIIKGEEVDLGILPLTTHNELDGGPFVASGTLICRDPETGRINIGLYRHHVQGKDQLGVWFMTGHHGDYVRQRYEEMGKEMEVAIAIGHHPCFVMGAVSRIPGIGGEYEEAGALLQEPVEVIRGETVDLPVPARAEIIIEGVIPPGARQFEGPFGEWPGHYTGEGPKPYIKVKAITMRRDAIYYDVFGAHREHTVLGSLPRMGSIYRRVKQVVPGLVGVNVPAHARMHCYLAIKKANDAEVKKAAFAALLTEAENLKMVIVVDEDINVFDEQEVMWALGTRFKADQDLLVIPGWQNPGGLNPANFEFHADGSKTPTKLACMVLDATKPAPPIPFPPRAVVPPAEVAKVKLEGLRDMTLEDLRARIRERV